MGYTKVDQFAGADSGETWKRGSAQLAMAVPRELGTYVLVDSDRVLYLPYPPAVVSAIVKRGSKIEQTSLGGLALRASTSHLKAWLRRGVELSLRILQKACAAICSAYPC